MTTNVPADKSPTTSWIPGNCRTLASVTASQPGQVQPRTLKPSLVLTPAGIAGGEAITGVSDGAKVGNGAVGVAAPGESAQAETRIAKVSRIVPDFTSSPCMAAQLCQSFSDTSVISFGRPLLHNC